MSLMRASSYDRPDRFGWKSSPTTWRKRAEKSSNPVPSGSSMYRISTSTFKPQGDNACGWSESTRTSHFMRDPAKAERGKGKRGHQKGGNDQMSCSPRCSTDRAAETRTISVHWSELENTSVR